MESSQTNVETKPVNPIPMGQPSVLLPSVVGTTLPYPQTQTQPAQQPQQPLNVVSVLTALRRRWFLALILGIPLGLGAAFAAWSLIPETYTAYTEVRVRTVIVEPPGGAPGDKLDHSTFKQTLMKQVVSPQVIREVLRDEKIAGLSMIKSEEDSERFLEQSVKRVDVGKEFFRFQISGTKPAELDLINKAMAKAFKGEVLDLERTQLDQKIAMYKSLEVEAQTKVDEFYKDFHRISGRNAATTKQFDQAQKARIEEKLLKIRERAAVELKIRNLKLVLDFQKSEAENSKSPKISDKEIDAFLASEPAYRAILEKIANAEGRLLYLKNNFTNHPDVKKVDAEIADLKAEQKAMRKKAAPLLQQRLVQGFQSDSDGRGVSLKTQLRFLEQERDQIKKEIEAITIETKGDNTALQELQKLENDYSNQSKYLESLKSTIRHLNAEKDFREKSPRTTIESIPGSAVRDSAKKRYMGTAAAGFGVFGLWVAGLVFLDIRTRRISSVQHVAEKVGLSIFGTIPTMPRNTTSRRNGRWSSKARYWHNVLTESIDAARTMLLKEAERNGTNIFMIASAMGGEGKTTVSCHLATSLARAGRSVLLIDADMRRPFVHRTFDLNRDPGLAEVLRAEAELADVVQDSGIPGLNVLTAGQISQATIDILAQDRLGKLFTEWRKQFDFIIVDTPPVMPVTDSLMIAQYVDGVLFAIRRDVSRVAKVAAACERLNMLGVPLLGAMAIGLSDDGYGHRYPYRYGYGYGYGDLPYGNSPT